MGKYEIHRSEFRQLLMVLFASNYSVVRSIDGFLEYGTLTSLSTIKQWKKACLIPWSMTDEPPYLQTHRGYQV